MVTGLMLAMAMAGNVACTKGSEEEPPLCPLRLAPIRQVVIETVGARAYDEPGDSESCRAFRPTVAQVRRYLAQARTTDARSADATLDRSPCHASGTIRFADGKVGRWRIEQLRVGTLSIAGREPLLVYCPSCTFRPFVR